MLQTYIDIKPPLRKPQLAFATQKQLPFYQLFKDHVNSQKEAALVQKYIKTHQMAAQICKHHSGKSSIVSKQTPNDSGYHEIGLSIPCDTFINIYYKYLVLKESKNSDSKYKKRY